MLKASGTSVRALFCVSFQCTSETFARSICVLFQATADALTVHGLNKILLPLKLMELCIRHDYPEVRPAGQQLR